MNRIVSLIASGTEIVSALGWSDRLVGRSHECDYPPSVLELPACTAAKFPLAGSSLEIDQRVKAVSKDEISVYRVDAELLDELQPDLIVTQALCEVCAVSLRDVEQACKVIRSQPRVVSLEANALADVWQDILEVAKALGIETQGPALVERLERRMEEVATRVRARSGQKTVACIEWVEPLMAAGNWVPELVEMAGGINLFGRAGEHSPWLSWEELREADPDVIVVMPCGFGLERTRSEMSALTSLTGWSALKAVRERRVFLTDGNQYFNRPGPRLVESLEILAEILADPEIGYGHRGRGWEPF